MRKILSIIILTLLFQSCVTNYVYQQNCDCENQDVKELFSKITTSLLKENFTIRHSDLSIGYLEAYSVSRTSSIMGSSVGHVWVIQFEKNKIIAYAKAVQESSGSLNISKTTNEKYYNDNAGNESGWYWNIKDDLEKICNNKIKVIKLDKTSRRNLKSDSIKTK